jgi:hypothetical protein
MDWATWSAPFWQVARQYNSLSAARFYRKTGDKSTRYAGVKTSAQKLDVTEIEIN